MQRGIYYLVVRNTINNEKIRIELTDRKENKYCTTLSYIDKLTTHFNNKEQLLDRLYKNKYINFLDGDIYIEYNHKELKFREVLFSDMSAFATLSMQTESMLDYKDKNVLNAIYAYINELNKRNFRNYVLNSPKVNLHLKKCISDYYNNQFTSNAIKYRDKIVTEMLMYKTFRDFKFLIDEYNNPKLQQEIEDKNKLRLSAKTKDNNVKMDLDTAIIEHKLEKEEFLTDDDYNKNYYPYSMFKKTK